MKRVALVLVFLAGCGDDVMCAARDGAYTLTLTEISGDCGPVDDLSVEVGDPVPEGCSRSETVSPDGCYIERVLVCTSGPLAGSSATIEMHISEDGLSTSGDVGVALRDPDTNALVCASQYEMTGVFVAP